MIFSFDRLEEVDESGEPIFKRHSIEPAVRS
jgi:hypothetical protein